jgi:hypothetical protein
LEKKSGFLLFLLRAVASKNPYPAIRKGQVLFKKEVINLRKAEALFGRGRKRKKDKEVEMLTGSGTGERGP